MALLPLVVIRGQTCQLGFVSGYAVSFSSFSSSVPLFFPSILPFFLSLSIRDPIQRPCDPPGWAVRGMEGTCWSLSEGLEMH